MTVLRVLMILGQRPADTGSGVLVRELWRTGKSVGDDVRVVCAGYPDDEWASTFGSTCVVIGFTGPGGAGEISFGIPGMSDVMPYPSERYASLSAAQVREFVEAYGRHFNHLLDTFQPDVVHVHHLWMLVALSELCDCPFIVTVHGTDLKLARTARQHCECVTPYLGRINHLFCVSKEILDDVTEEYELDSSQMSVLGCGYDPRVFRLGSATTASVEPIVLAAGKFVDWKGFRYLIRASARIPIRHRLVILGSGPASERDALLREGQRCGVPVDLPGHVAQAAVAKWMQRAHVFALPSLHEPFGTVLLEAMACGCRVVASASGGPLDIVAPDLLRRGLASLVQPLSNGMPDPDTEERYVRDLARELTAQLCSPDKATSRLAVGRSVAGMTWEAVYREMRRTYISQVGHLRSEDPLPP